MVICKICEKELVSIKALSQHIRFHEITSKEYYDDYIGNPLNCPECGKETEFLDLSRGYQKFCSLKCSNNNETRKNEFRKSYLKNDMYSVKEKRKKTNLSRYGNENANLSHFIQEKTKNIFRSKFGVDNPMKLKEISSKSRIRYKENFINVIIPKILYIQNLELVTPYSNAHDVHTFKCTDCSFEFEEVWNYIQQGKRCPNCNPKLSGKSKIEDEIVSFLSTLDIGKIITGNKKIIKPKQIDIFIEEKNIGIEFNGLYWHSEENLDDPNYHYNKTNECLKKGIKLIQIFEDEWLFNKDLVKERLQQILNTKNKIRIHARKCIISEISSKVKNEFLEKYHIQGPDSAKVKIGAFYNNELVSVMTFNHGNISKGSRQEEGVWELNRFCSNYKYHIPGIASKILKFFRTNYKWIKIFSYADRRWSSGDMYYKLGFELEKITKPNYWYIKDYKRVHRFSLRKKDYEPKDIPEWFLRRQEGYYRIWDCGNLKFSMINKITEE